MNIALNLPLNKVSLGQVSTLILRTIYEQEVAGLAKHEIFLFPIGQIDFGSQKLDEKFQAWVNSKILNGLENYSRDIPVFKLWHLNGSLESVSRKQSLLTFYELDEPTKIELNIARNNNLLFSSQYSCANFKAAGVDSTYLPLGFDSYNFKTIPKNPHSDGRIVFNLCGKFEKRKNHARVIKSWIKKFGGNPKVALQCAVFNPFMGRSQEEVNKNNQQIIGNVLGGVKPFNVEFFPMMAENEVYNAFLNSADIILGMSGAEGFGLPEFQSIALGKHAVLLKAHSYLDWATDDMVTWVNPTGKTPAYDGVFFQKGQPFNQGNIYDFNDDEFIAACEAAIKRVEAGRVNLSGLTLQQSFSKERFVDGIINSIS